MYTVTSHSEMYSMAKAGSCHEGSHSKYTERLRKHQRNPKDPSEMYSRPLTTSQMYGWWMSEGEPLKQEWTQGERRVYVNSEMTRFVYLTFAYFHSNTCLKFTFCRFVNEMSLTNKDFSLY